MESGLQCQACLKPPSSRLPFLCPTCARNVLYEPRVQHTQALLGNEALRREVDGALSEDTGARVVGIGYGYGKAAAGVVVERVGREMLEIKEEVAVIRSAAGALRDTIMQMKEDIYERRGLLAKREMKLAETKRMMAEKETDVGALKEQVEKVEEYGGSVHQKIGGDRRVLCREVCGLYGLQQKKRKKGASGRDIYLLGGVSVVDIRDINNTPPSQITVSCNYLAHLLHLTSHYLSLRLPAEILLPSPNSPYTQILSPHSSYNDPIPLPPLKPTIIASSSSSSPSSSHHSTPRSLPRPRFLYVDKPVLTLATEDPLAYSYLIEAITLLAWDIAWLCKTQGLDVTARSWEDICAMGRNLWLLFVAPQTSSRPPASRNNTDMSGKTITAFTATTPAKANVPQASEEWDSAIPLVGHYSHGTNHSFLNSAEGMAYMRDWKYASPVRLIEKVKNALASERIAEWEVVEEAEWEATGEGNGTGLKKEREPNVKREKEVEGKERAKREDRDGNKGADGGTGRTSRGAGRLIDEEAVGRGDEKEKEDREGGKGWMKVRGRGGEV